MSAVGPTGPVGPIGSPEGPEPLIPRGESELLAYPPLVPRELWRGVAAALLLLVLALLAALAWLVLR